MRSLYKSYIFLSKIGCLGRPVNVAVPHRFESSIKSTRSETLWIDFCREDWKLAKQLKIMPNSSLCLVDDLDNSIHSHCRVLTDLSSNFTCPTAAWTRFFHYGK